MVQEVLKDDRGGSGVKPHLPPPPVFLAPGKTALSLVARESLILKMNRESRIPTQRLDETQDIGRLSMGCPVKGAWQADHHPGQAILFTREGLDFASKSSCPLPDRPGDRQNPIRGRQYG